MSNNPITLRPFSEKDKIALAKLCNNKKIWDNVRDYLPHPYSEEDAEFFINLCLKDDPVKNFAITYYRELAGTIGIIPQTDVYRLSAEIGYWLGEPFWGKGIATEAVRQIVAYGKETFGLIRFYAGIFAFNKASMRVLEKAGFQQEGISKKAVIKNGVTCDEYQYGLLLS
ncbi:MAG: GNAT family protein [Bacteroidota bacterium]